jgi:hypothetical protein
MSLELLLNTDRGALAVSRGDTASTLRRIFDSGVATREFRRAIDELKFQMAKGAGARILPPIHHEQVGDHYFLEYRLDSQVCSVGSFFAQATWLERVQFAADVIHMAAEWRRHVTLPVGLHSGRLVVCKPGHRWIAHLAPCPRVPGATTYSLLRADPSVLAGIAPESVRGVAAAGLLEDVYAAGALVLQALGWGPQPDLPPAKYVELSASAQLLTVRHPVGPMEAMLKQLPSVAERFAALESEARKCMQFEPLNRPESTESLYESCQRVLALAKPEAFVAGLREKGRDAEALHFVDLASEAGTVSPELHRQAALCARRLGNPVKELQHLEGLAAAAAHDRESMWRRWQLRYEAYLSRDSAHAGAADAEAQWLITELKRLGTAGGGMDGEPMSNRDQLLSEAMIHGHSGDLLARARVLHKLTELDYLDVESLLLYGLALREMADAENAQASYRAELKDSVRKLYEAVCERINRLMEAERFDAKEVEEWRERFELILLS